MVKTDMRNSKFIGSSFVFALMLFFVTQPVFAKFVAGDVLLNANLSSGTIIVGQQPNSNGYSQIYFELNGNKTFITDENFPNANPKIDGDYITWMAQIDGVWQIRLYHIPTKKTLQLSTTANNSNPQISDGKVAWQGQVNGIWQIFVFDGTKIMQLTDGDLSINPEIEKEFVAYGRKDVNGTYRSVVYSLAENEAREIAAGNSSKRPILKSGEIIFNENDKEVVFPLTIEDMFTLKLNPLAVLDVPTTATQEETVNELLRGLADFDAQSIATDEAI